MRTTPTTREGAGRAALIAMAAVLLFVGFSLTSADFSGFGPGTALAPS